MKTTSMVFYSYLVAVMDDSVSAFIVGTCRILPKSDTDVFQSINIRYYNSCPFYEIFCGSSAEFFIQPLHSIINDIDYLKVRPYYLAFTDEIPVLPNELRHIADITGCFLIEPYHDYPSFVRLRHLGRIVYNWERKIFEFDRTEIREKFKTDHVFAHEYHEEFVTSGPAFKLRRKNHSLPCPSVDIVKAIWCPQWPKQAKNWPFRERKYGWPTTANIRKIVQSGCHVVYAKHSACRNYVDQLRLSFSVAEVILLQSWTPVQQIVYHMLRFFAKRELIKKDCPKEDEVLCTYHLKTLMLWTCEETAPNWWNSTSVIKICCNLLQKLTIWLKDKTCPNYFIPRANLLRKNVNPKIYDDIMKRLISFCDSDFLCLWFVEHYIQPISLFLYNLKHTCTHSRCVYELMSRTCHALEARKSECVDLYFSGRFTFSIGYAHAAAKEGFGYDQPDAIKHQFRIASTAFQPSTEVESCFEFYESMLLILHAAYMINFTTMQYDSEWFIEVVRQITVRPKFLRCMHNNFPEPWITSPNKSQLYFLKAQDMMDNLTGSSDDLEFQLVSQLSENLFTKALECADSKTHTIANATLVYMAALHIAASKYRIATDLCLTVIRNQAPEKEEKENLIASCLYFIDDIARIIGLHLLISHVEGTLRCSRRQSLLDLRLTSVVFAHYLINLSNERGSRPLVVSYDLHTPKFPLDEILLTMTNWKSSRMSSRTESVVRVYQRIDPICKLLAAIKISFLNKDELTFVLKEYALENMESFYNAICKDIGIHCNIVNCYRAAYLYQCRKYPEVLNLCERMLDEPEVQRDLKEFAFANVMVVPPLDSYFDTDVQCLLGLHTLVCSLSPLNGVSTKTEHDCSSKFQQVFAREIKSGKDNLSVVLKYDYSMKFNYFLGRHFLARYLKVRCLIDCHHSSSEVMIEFGKLRSHLPFEHIIRCSLQQNLRNFSQTEKIMHQRLKICDDKN